MKKEELRGGNSKEHKDFFMKRLKSLLCFKNLRMHIEIKDIAVDAIIKD